MGSLRSWLQEIELRQFQRDYLGREPLARANVAQPAADSCTWHSLAGMLESRPDDVLVVARGRDLELPVPRSLSHLRRLFDAGIGLAIRSAERHSASVSRLCRDFAEEQPGQQRVIVFATPAKTHGFGWHYDAEDVFIVQTAGDKEYLFHKNTVAPPLSPTTPPDFSLHARETTPIMSCRLIAGDFLYLPRNYWHVAYAHADSLSISIGVFPQ